MLVSRKSKPQPKTLSTGVQQHLLFVCNSEEEINKLLDVDTPENPFHDYVGNYNAIVRGTDYVYKAYKSRVYGPNHMIVCNRKVSANLLITGPRSVGKTQYARRLARLVGTPYAEVDAANTKKVDEIYDAIARACLEKKVPLVPQKVIGTMRHYTPPPMVLFLDEIHRLPVQAQEGLLKCLEGNDRVLQLGNMILHCENILFLLATTNSGALLDTLKSRCDQIDLQRHTIEEVGQMVQNQFGWSDEQCLKVAKYCPIPRKALDVFAKGVQVICERQSCSVADGIAVQAERQGLDENGLNNLAADVLLALNDAGDTGLSRRNLCSQLAITEDEFTGDILPLLMSNSQHGSFVRIAHKHFITEAGIEALQRRMKA